MNLKKRWAAITGTVLIAGSIFAGGALASGASETGTAIADRIGQAVEAGKLTEGEAGVLKQVHELRKAAMEKLRADSKAVIDQAVKDGKITQEQADRLLKHKGHAGRGGFGKGRFHKKSESDQPKSN